MAKPTPSTVLTCQLFTLPSGLRFEVCGYISASEAALGSQHSTAPHELREMNPLSLGPCVFIKYGREVGHAIEAIGHVHGHLFDSGLPSLAPLNVPPRPSRPRSCQLVITLRDLRIILPPNGAGVDEFPTLPTPSIILHVRTPELQPIRPCKPRYQGLNNQVNKRGLLRIPSRSGGDGYYRGVGLW